MKKGFLLLFGFLFAAAAAGQAVPELLTDPLAQPLHTPDVVGYQLRQYLFKRAAQLPRPVKAEEWRTSATRIRKHLLEDVVYHGWSDAWVSSPPKFEEVGIIETGSDYRLRKLRYEIVPGFQSAAILYEPLNVQGKLPAILDVNGHEYGPGKAVEFKQKRCINFAKHGILALSLEWLNCGELNKPGNAHDFANHLNLVGASGVGLFYLAMRRGLDYLWEHPNVDRQRLGVTGLSGGGWQTIVLSALDERVAVAVPVAGFSPLTSKLARSADFGDAEQVPPDFLAGQDYSHLVAMLAPRPTLLIHNAEDNCCFRAALVKPCNYEQVKPFFELFGKGEALAWYENRDPGYHNYQLDTRLQAYRFFSRHFGLPVIDQEIPVDTEILSDEQLAVGLPADNLSMLGLAKKLEADIQRPPASELQARTRLKETVRYRPVQIERTLPLFTTKNRGIETLSYRFDFDNGLSATGVWAKAIVSPDHSPATIVLDDGGKKTAAEQVADRINRGEQVLAADLLFSGDASPVAYDRYEFPMLLSSAGARPVGLEAAQLLALARWLRDTSGSERVRLETRGMRNQLVALVAAALDPALFSELVVREGIPTLKYLLDTPVEYEAAPDMFCPDLFKEFDLGNLATLASRVRLTAHYVKPSR